MIEKLLFLLYALGACGGAVAVVISQNVVRMAFWLIISLGSAAGLFFLLHADFVGAAQLLIYVGGTVVLLIFGVMLTASGPYVRIKTSPGEGLGAAVVGALFLALVVSTVYAIEWDVLADKVRRPGKTAVAYKEPGTEASTARPIGLKLIGVSPEDIGGKDTKKLSTGYLLPFEIVSVHLLVVLVGAAYLARAKRRVDASPQSGSGQGA